MIESSAKDPVVYNSLFSEAMFEAAVLAATNDIALDILASTYKANKPAIKEALIDRIERAARADWSTVAQQDSFGKSRIQRINSSMSTAYKKSQQDIETLRREVARINRNVRKGNYGLLKKYKIEGLSKEAAAKKAINRAVTNQQRVTEKFLGYHENRLTRTESKSIWYNKFKKKNKRKKVLWVCSSNPCSICAQYCGKVYNSPRETAMIPQHANCSCGLEVVNTSKK